MAQLIEKPTEVKAAGNLPKVIREYVGRINTGHDGISIAHMISPSGWVEPGQTPEFEEYTLVIKGVLRIETRTEVTDVPAGQAVICSPGEWVRYSTPGDEGAEYIAICLPAFSSETVHRDED